MKYVKLITALLLITLNIFSQSKPAPGLKLWYNESSGRTWERALPVGNGRLAAMIYGNVEKENLQLNEASVWSGGPNRNDNPNALAALPEIRKLIFDGKQKEAQALAARTMENKVINGMMFQPVGNLFLQFKGHENYTDYYRELDIEKAIATTSYTANGVHFKREVFASVPAQAIIIRLTADQPGKINFTASFASLQKSKSFIQSGNELTLTGITSDHESIKGQVKFHSSIKINIDGGKITPGDTTLQVAHASSATVFISIATNFVNYHDISADQAKRCEDYLSGAMKSSYPQLLAAHVAAFQKYFNRVKLNLGDNGNSAKPTDQRLKEFASGADPQLVTLYFQYGRYLLISCSQPGGQPATLQGLWNDKMNPPWDSKYTININTEMNYWPAEKDNLSEMHEPLVQMVKELAESGQETARVMYGSRGWMAHHNTDLWRITGPVDAIFWGVWSMGGAWLSQHLWEKYLYSGDKKYLSSVYPVLKGAAMFFVDDLVEDPVHHWLVINPGTSPENAPSTRRGVSFDAGTTMDNQIVFDMLSTAIRAAEALQTDKAFVDTLKAVRKRLPPMHIGKHNQLQEWLEDLDDPNDHHRHISHLYGLYPANQISPYRTAELFSAAHTTLLQRGDISTGWSMGWKVNWWARFQDGDHAYKLITNQLTPVGTNAGGGGTYPNLFDAHAPFQIDGNFGCTSGITEMLMQSQDGAIQLLPALPSLWKEGSITGLRTRGGFTITDLQWKDGKLSKLIIKSTIGGNCRLRVADPIKNAEKSGLKKASGKNPNPFFQTEEIAAPVISSQASLSLIEIPKTIEYDLMTVAGKSYTFLF